MYILIKSLDKDIILVFMLKETSDVFPLLTLGLVTISHIQRAAKGPHAIRYPRAVIAII